MLSYGFTYNNRIKGPYIDLAYSYKTKSHKQRRCRIKVTKSTMFNYRQNQVKSKKGKRLERQNSEHSGASHPTVRCLLWDLRERQKPEPINWRSVRLRSGRAFDWLLIIFLCFSVGQAATLHICVNQRLSVVNFFFSWWIFVLFVVYSLVEKTKPIYTG